MIHHVQLKFMKCLKLCKLAVLGISWSIIFKDYVFSCMTCDDLVHHVHVFSYMSTFNLPVSIMRRRHDYTYIYI